MCVCVCVRVCVCVCVCVCVRAQGRTQNLMWVGSFQEKVDLFGSAGVQSTPSMQSMLKLGGSGGMPPQEYFEK